MILKISAFSHESCFAQANQACGCWRNNITRTNLYNRDCSIWLKGDYCKIVSIFDAWSECWSTDI